VLAERRRSRKRGGETQRPRRSLSGAAVKRCGVAFPRPRMNGSSGRTRTVFGTPRSARFSSDYAEGCRWGDPIETQRIPVPGFTADTCPKLAIELARRTAGTYPSCMGNASRDLSRRVGGYRCCSRAR
jgi:hypothetical protein